MRSYLFVGNNEQDIEERVVKFIKKNNLQRFDYVITSIDSVRDLNRITSFDRGGVGIVIKNINKASEEAMNAFLKNLEEPQKICISC
jgi:DNA polymerase III delta prime subunit